MRHVIWGDQEAYNNNPFARNAFTAASSRFGGAGAIASLKSCFNSVANISQAPAEMASKPAVSNLPTP